VLPLELPDNGAWPSRFVSETSWASQKKQLRLNEWTVVTVGESQHWVDEIAERAKKLKVKNGFEPDSDL
jgi:hypothetical protein